MIKRYEIESISNIWSDENKFLTWLEVEKAVLLFFYKTKKISIEEYNDLLNQMKFDIEDIKNLEKETNHDVVAFTRAISLNVKTPAKKWIHFGLTSTDIVDTANAILIKKTNDIIYQYLHELSLVLKRFAFKYKKTYQIGRTHGIHAEITTFGFKFALWFDELNRNLKRFALAREQIEVGKISGAVGTFANTGTKMQDFVCKVLKIKSSNISTQVIQRDNHAFYFATLALIGATIEKIASELRHLSRTEISEVTEGFSANQKGSSAMPHKKNPISLENVCGLSRLLKGYMITSFENVPLWDERDISHSSNERVLFLDATTIIAYISKKLSNIIANLNVNNKRMLDNIKSTRGIIFSQQVLLELIKNNNYSREKIYDEIQKLAYQSINENSDFLELLKNSLPKDFEINNLDKIFDFNYHLKYIDEIYKRVFINGKKFWKNSLNK